MKKFTQFFTTRNIITGGIILGLIIALFQIDSCRNRDFKSQEKKFSDSLAFIKQEFTETVNKKQEVITKQEAIITSDQKSLKDLTLAVFDLKAKDEKRIKQINALIRIKSKTGIDSIEIAYVDTVERKRFSDSVEKVCADVINYFEATTIQVPKPISYTSIDTNHKVDFKFDGTIGKDKFTIDSLSFPNEQNISVIETKGGFFKRDIKGKRRFFTPRKMEIMVSNSNKYVHVEGMNSMIYKSKVGGRWVERLGIFGVAVVATALILK